MRAPGRLAALAFLLPVVAHAQVASTGTIAGRVIDSASTPLAAVVTAAWADGSYRHTMRASADGTFEIGALPPGRYDLSVQRVGYRPSSVHDVRVIAGGTSRLTVTLARAVAELEAVVVETPVVTIRRGDTQFETRVDETALRTLPVGLDVDRAIAFTPGARPAQLWGGATAQANNYQFDGVAMNHPGVGGRFFEPNVSWIDQLEVRGLGAGAEYGDFQGGLVDFVTKSGSNTPQGFLRADAQTDRLDASNLTPTVIVPELRNRRDIEAEHRGAIVHDRLFYYVSGQLLRTDFQAVNHLAVRGTPSSFFSPVTETSTEHKTLAKLSFVPSASDLLTASVGHLGTSTTHFALTGRETADATSQYAAPIVIYDGSWDHTLGRFGTVQTKVGGMQQTEHVDPYADDTIPAISTYQLANARDYQNAPFTERRRAVTTDASATWRAATALGATDHRFTAGVQGSWGAWDDVRARNGGLTWRPRYYNPVDLTFNPDDASTWDPKIPFSVGGEVDLHTHTTNRAEFVEDEVTTGRLTTTAGVRFGQWTGRIAAPSGEEFTAVRTSGVDPRIGAVLDFSRQFSKGSDPTFVLKAHWGRYHQGMFAELFDRAAGSQAYTDQDLYEYEGARFSNSATTISPAQLAAMRASGQVQLMEHADLSETGRVSGFRQPYVDQLVLGLEKTVASRLKVEAVFVQRDNFDQPGLVDRNAAADWTPFSKVMLQWNSAIPGPVPIGGFLPDQNGNPLDLGTVYVRNDAIIASLREYARLSRIDPTLAAPYAVPGFTPADTAKLAWNPDYVLTSVPQAKRRFRQLQLNFTYDANSTSAALSLAMSSLRGNFASVTGYDDNTIYGRDAVVGRGPGPYVRPNEAINDLGRLENYSPFEAKLRASHQFRWGFLGGVFASMTTGDPVTPALAVQQYGFDYLTNGAKLPNGLITAISGERIYTAERGTYQYRPHGSVDLHLEHAIGGAAGARGAARHAVTLTLDAFNILNDRTPIQENTDLDAQVDPNVAVKYGAALQRADPQRFRFGGIVRF